MKQRVILKAVLLVCALVTGCHVAQAGTYVKVTSTSDLVSGGTYVIATNAALVTGYGSALAKTSMGYTLESGTLTTTTATPMEVTLGMVGSGNYTLLMSGGNYLGWKGSSTDFEKKTSSSDTKEQWTLTYNSTYDMFLIWNVSDSKRVISGKDYIKVYESGGLGDPYLPATLYRKVTSASVTVSTAKYATFYHPMLSLDFTESGVTAYLAKVTDGYVSLTAINKVPANTPVVLYQDVESKTTTNIPLATSTDDATDNQLQVSDGSTAISDETTTIYVLANKSAGVGFYKWAGASSLSEGRVYLPVTVSSGAREYLGFGDGATGIDSVTRKTLNGKMYNLQGQEVTDAKGIVIVNGKKVILK